MTDETQESNLQETEWYCITAASLLGNGHMSICTFGPFESVSNILGKVGEIQRSGDFHWVGWGRMTKWGAA
jgi:hypothetical protein